MKAQLMRLAVAPGFEEPLLRRQCKLLCLSKIDALYPRDVHVLVYHVACNSVFALLVSHWGIMLLLLDTVSTERCTVMFHVDEGSTNTHTPSLVPLAREH